MVQERRLSGEGIDRGRHRTRVVEQDKETRRSQGRVERVRRLPRPDKQTRKTIEYGLAASKPAQPVVRERDSGMANVLVYHRSMGAPNTANLSGWDYRELASRLPARTLIDFHAHLNGPHAAAVYSEVASLFGVRWTLSQTRLADAQAIRDILGDRIRFVAIWDWSEPDRGRMIREGFVEAIPLWHDRFGARVVKLWGAPRLWDLAASSSRDPRDAVPLDSEWRIRAATVAQDLGMAIMVHVADPDTWFATKYADSQKYGTKRAHHDALERMLDRFPGPWIAAHMGGSPEDLGFLSGLLQRHSNLYLDTSATKWVVRELSRHPREIVREFFTRWRGRILFGSDIVTTDEHLIPKPAGAATPMGDLAQSPDEAFDLYASRYWALRTLLETRHEGPSPIADPDLMMVDPVRNGPTASPILRGAGLDDETLASLMADAAQRLFDSLAPRPKGPPLPPPDARAPASH